MIDFDYIEANKDTFRNDFLTAKPFCLLAIDNFCKADKIKLCIKRFPKLKPKVQITCLPKTNSRNRSFGPWVGYSKNCMMI
jgi:hypothetical protein